MVQHSVAERTLVGDHWLLCQLLELMEGASLVVGECPYFAEELLGRLIAASSDY